MTTALGAARYLIYLATPNEDEDADCLCHLRLQRLLYYVQGWHLGTIGTPLFSDRIEVGPHGPVVSSVSVAFKDFRFAIPPSEGTESAELSKREKEFVRSIWERYARFSATALREMVQREVPLAVAHAEHVLNGTSGTGITPEALRAYFLPRYVELLQRQDSRIDVTRWKASADAVAAGRVRSAKDIRRELQHRRAGANPV